MMKRLTLFVLAGSSLLAACNKKDTPLYRKTIGAVESVHTFAGKERVKLTWNLPADKSISECRIYWNNGADSVKLNILNASVKDSMIINNLQEGKYTFSLKLFDGKGNASEPVFAEENVYGKNYTSSIKNAIVQNVSYNNSEATATIEWKNTGAGVAGFEVKYTDSAGILQNIISPSFLNTIILKKYKAYNGNTILYRTLFLPEVTAIDTFYTNWDTLLITPGKILWDGNATKGNSVWKTINVEQSGTVTVVHDPAYGDVWKFHKPAGSHRAEAHGVNGFQAKEGDDIYIGWISKLIMPQDLSTFAIFQWKSYPTDGSLQNHPLMIRTTDGNLRLRDYQAGDIAHDDWSLPLEINSWHTFVIRIKVSRDKNTGFIEFWYDGVMQTLINGTTRQYCRTLDSDNCDPIWGVYGGDEGDAVNLVGKLKIATTYELARPD